MNKEVMDYIRKTPVNTNPSVVNSMIDKLLANAASEESEAVEKARKEEQEKAAAELKEALAAAEKEKEKAVADAVAAEKEKAEKEKETAVAAAKEEQRQTDELEKEAAVEAEHQKLSVVTATAADIRAGKVALGLDGEIVGTAQISEES